MHSLLQGRLVLCLPMQYMQPTELETRRSRQPIGMMSIRAEVADIDAMDAVASILPGIAAALSAHEADISRAESALQLCVRYVGENPESMRQHVEVWLLPALGLLLNPHSTANTVNTLFDTLKSLSPLDPTLPDTLERHMRDNDTLNKMLGMISSQATTTCGTPHPGVRAIKAWALYVGLLGRNLSQVNVANHVLKVAEKAFVAEDVMLRASAHESWLALVRNFHANNMLSHPKRARLLVAPAKNCLASNGCRSDIIMTACLRTWKELLSLLPNHTLRELYNIVFTPLLDALVTRRRDKRAIAPNAITTLLDTLCEFLTHGHVSDAEEAAAEQHNTPPAHAMWVVSNTPHIIQHIEGLRGDKALAVEAACDRVFVATVKVVVHVVKDSEGPNTGEDAKLHVEAMSAILAHVATLSTVREGVCAWEVTQFMLDVLREELNSKRFSLHPPLLHNSEEAQPAEDAGNVVTLCEYSVCLWMNAALKSQNREDITRLTALILTPAMHISIKFVAECFPWLRYQDGDADFALWAWCAFAEELAKQLNECAAKTISTSAHDIQQLLDIMCVPVRQLATTQPPHWEVLGRSAFTHARKPWLSLLRASEMACTHATNTTSFLQELCSRLVAMSSEAKDTLKPDCVSFLAECLLELLKGGNERFLQLPSARNGSDITPARAISGLLGALLRSADADIAAGPDIELGAISALAAVSALSKQIHSQADAFALAQELAQPMAKWLNTTSAYSKVSPPLRVRVVEAWGDVLACVRTRSLCSCDSALLNVLAPALKDALTHTDGVIVNGTVAFWNATFAKAKALQHDWFPTFVRSLSTQCALQAPAGWHISPPGLAISPPVKATKPSMPAAIKPSSPMSPTTATATAETTPKSTHKNDINQANTTFVAIPARAKAPKKQARLHIDSHSTHIKHDIAAHVILRVFCVQVLTEHQREVRREQLSSKPALYTKLDGPSQPAWGLDSQSQDCSQSQAAAEVSVTLAAPKRVQLVQCDNNANNVDANIAKESSPPATDAAVKPTPSPKRAHEHTYTTPFPERKRVKIVAEEATPCNDGANNKPHTNSCSEPPHATRAHEAQAAYPRGDDSIGLPCCDVAEGVAPEASTGEPSLALALACSGSEQPAASPNAVGSTPTAEANTDHHHHHNNNNNYNNIKDSKDNDTNMIDNHNDDANKQLVEAHAGGGSLILSLPPDTPLALLRRLSTCLADNSGHNKSLSPGLSAQELWDAQECLGEMSRCVAAALRRLST
eukprot:jgi/Chlat1/4260/Chrsp279S00311